MQYTPPWWLRNGHVQSIIPSLFRKVDGQFVERVRLDTPDDDFIDLDIARKGNKRVLIVTHGLEGNSQRPYCLGMMKAGLSQDWDAVAWNFRSCSGEPNRKLASYHSGQTRDLEQVINWALAQGYVQIGLVGFSIGGNKTLLYLGRDGIDRPEALVGAVTFSVPVDLRSSAHHLAKRRNRIYMQNFLNSFREKLEQKSELFPGQVDLERIKTVRTFLEYDEHYTAPMNGFESAEHYWRESSSKTVLEQIQLPTLLINAQDDPFLTPECFPETAVNPCFRLETPRYGGHVGFMSLNRERRYWSESRALAFLNSCSNARTRHG
ncbi:MAG: alpha/beta hydrolase [Oleiphilus sp.]|nr:MAG: alpha/beta hydrolase [Oleiphilus sp.]